MLAHGSWRKPVNARNNNATVCKDSLWKDWIVHRGRLRLTRIDPDGCYMGTDMLNKLHSDLAIDTEVIPGETSWRLSTTGVNVGLVKRTAHTTRWTRRRAASCQECLLRLARQQSATKVPH